MHFRSFFPSARSAAVATAAVAAFTLALHAQQTQPGTTAPGQPATTTQPGDTVQAGSGTLAGSSQTSTDVNGKVSEGATLSYSPGKNKKPKTAKSDRVVQSKDTRLQNAKSKKLDPLAGKDASLPDKVLYDKALYQTSKGHFDVARLDLQTLLNTYPDSQYQMRAKLAIADSWYKEGGSAALTQAEQEYNDFITFFPQAPEAAEAQMRVGDIYFKQIDVPDRDYTKAVKAEDAYRLMLKQYPDSSLNKEARQKLREVQEVLATREAALGAFYQSHGNWPASIARYQTVVDMYPLYSHMDDVLIGIGDDYAAESRLARTQAMPEGPKAKVVQTYDSRAADAYRKVVLDHSAAPHVEDAKERLESMGMPIPTPTTEQAATSEALEGSRAQYNLQRRLAVFFLHRPDTVLTAQAGDPPLDDVAITTAPAVGKDMISIVTTAYDPNAGRSTPAALTPASAADTAASPAPATPAEPAGSAPLALQDVAGPGQGASGGGDTTTMTAAPAAANGGGGSRIAAEVLTPGVAGNVVVNKAAVRDASTTGDTPGGLKAIGTPPETVLDPIVKPEEAPDAINDVNGHPQPPAQVLKPGEKAPKTPVDKEDESSSKKKPKKGLDKLNPF